MESIPETRKIEIEEETLKTLNTTRKWTMFISIIGFILLGLLLVIGFIAGTFLTAFKIGDAGLGIPESMALIIIFVLSLVYFFPVFFLFRFSKHTANAVQSLNKEDLRKAFRNLKFYFIYLGVLLIMAMVLYLAALIFTGSSMGFLKGLV
jgi:hypothetical protein